MPRFVTFFAAGYAFHYWRGVIPRSRWILLTALAAIVACHRSRLYLTLPVAGTYCLFHLAYSRTIDLSWVGKLPDLSYGVYLYGFPVQQVLVRYLGDRLNPITLAITTLPIAFAFAYVSARLVEEPAMRWKSGPIRRPANRPAEAA